MIARHHLARYVTKSGPVDLYGPELTYEDWSALRIQMALTGEALKRCPFIIRTPDGTTIECANETAYIAAVEQLKRDKLVAQSELIAGPGVPEESKQ